MQIKLINSDKDLYVAAYKFIKILGPIAGGLIILGNLTMIYMETRPQNLPITHILTHSDRRGAAGRTFKLSVASTPEQLQKGLKFQASLKGDCGMLFNLGGEIYNVPFWMYKVNFPLDIFYLKDNVVTTAIYNAEPCHKTPCPIYKGRVANQVLELAPGVANIKVGDRLNIQPLSILPKNDIGFDSKNR